MIYWGMGIMVSIAVFLVISTHYVVINTRELHYEGIADIRYVHVTDIHGKTHFINGTLVDKLNRLSTDFVLLTGDLTHHVRQYPKVCEALGKVNGPVYIVLGNYENKNYNHYRTKKETIDFNRVLKELNKYPNLHLLINEGVVYNKSGYKVQIYGFDQSEYGREAFNLERSCSMYRIILSHSPMIIDYIETHNIGFQHLLVGHTHGKQINLGSWLRFPYGQFHIGDRWLDGNRLFTINRGIGTTHIPLRFNSQPEIRLYSITK